MKLTESSHVARKLAVEAGVHPRTVAKVVNGGKVRPMTLRRIEGTLAVSGWAKDSSGSWVAPKIQE
jgi:DNA-binding LacI/PurR family transcriptional regulator